MPLFDPLIFDPLIFDTGERVTMPAIYVEAITGKLGGGDKQNLRLFAGEDASWTLTMSPAVNVTGWGYRLVIRRLRSEAATLEKSSGFTVTNASTGVIQVAIRAADLEGKSGFYRYEVWRDDAGQEIVLAWGDLTVEW